MVVQITCGAELGAVDYVTKPFESEELLARVGTHIALRREIEAHRRSKATIRVLVEQMGDDGDALVGNSPALARVREQIAQVAATDSTVRIEGETGTGKELVARAIHSQSARRECALVKLNCAALPRELVESELFGHEKGAFTGAHQQRRGRFELADGGSLLLDEVGELPLEAQAKLLRVLQEREFERVGGSRALRVDVRVIAATNRDPRAEVAAGRFRADLFFRLNVFPIALPPLRERRDDIPRLLQHVVARIARRLGREVEGIAPAFIERARSRLAGQCARTRERGRAGADHVARWCARWRRWACHSASGRRSSGGRTVGASLLARGRARPHPRRARRIGLGHRRRCRRGAAARPESEHAAQARHSQGWLMAVCLRFVRPVV